MKRERYNDLNRRNLMKQPIKFTSAVLVLSSVLFGFDAVSTSPSAGAADRADTTISQNVDKRKQNLEVRIQEAKAEVERLKDIKENEKAQLKTDIGKAKSIEDVDTLLNKIKEKQSTSEQALSEETQKVESVKDKVNRDVEENVETSQSTPIQSGAADQRLDSGEANQSIDQFIADLENLSNKVDEHKPSEDETAQSSASQKADQGEHALSNLRNDIQRVTTEKQTSSRDLDQYVQNKEANLQELENRLAERHELSKSKADRLRNEIETTKENLKQQDSIVLDRLQSASDKREAVKSIIGNTVDEQQAQSILDRIETKGKTDSQIASQVLSQLDGLSSFSSDSLLESMFDKAEDKEALIQTLLSTKFEQQEAADKAAEIMRNHPNSAQIVQLLKQHYGSDISGDDILGNVIDQAHNQRQAIETILASKFNDAKARALANIIVKKEDKKAELLKLMTSDIDRHLNHLLKVDNDISRLKSDVRGIFDPLKDTPSLLQLSKESGLDKPLLGSHTGLFSGPSLLDKLLSGDSVLDKIPDIPNPSQGRALSLGNPSDDFLSGLFDDDGNFDLPAAGEAAKRSALPLGITFVIIGGGITWFVKRRKTKSS